MLKTFFKNTPEDHYKINEVKIFSSKDTLYENKKRYRRVYEKSETDYIYCELSFYNKLFDTRDWNATVTFEGFLLHRDSREKICSIEKEIKVSKEENIVKIREGWGNPTKGIFWGMGDYEWVLYINNNWAGKQTFYIEDAGKVYYNSNPYFDPESIILYEGLYEVLEDAKIQPIEIFSSEKTEYIWIHVTLKNKLETPWYCELHFNFFSECGYHKGYNSELHYISERQKNISIKTGWGANEKGTWFPGKYRIEIVFMEQLIETKYFEVI